MTARRGRSAWGRSLWFIWILGYCIKNARNLLFRKWKTTRTQICPSLHSSIIFLSLGCSPCFLKVVVGCRCVNFVWILQKKQKNTMYTMMSILPLGCRWLSFISFMLILYFPLWEHERQDVPRSERLGGIISTNIFTPFKIILNQIMLYD